MKRKLEIVYRERDKKSKSFKGISQNITICSNGFRERPTEDNETTFVNTIYISPYIPFLGILSGGITTAKHIYGHKTSTQKPHNDSTSDNPEN